MNPGLDERGSPAGRLLSQLRELALQDKVWGDRLWTARACPKGHVLFDPDNAPADLFILTEGLIKLVYVTPEGDERIKSFIADQGLFAAEGNGPAFGARTLEPSTIIRVPLPWLQQRIAENPDLQRAYGQFADWVRQRKSRREQALLCDSAAERFRAMLRLEPGLLSRLSQGDIARYLGITPIAFSRIKRRLSAAE